MIAASGRSLKRARTTAAERLDGFDGVHGELRIARDQREGARCAHYFVERSHQCRGLADAVARQRANHRSLFGDRHLGELTLDHQA